MIWARWAGVMGVPMKWEIARIFVVGTDGSGFCVEAAPSGVIGFFMALAPYSSLVGLNRFLKKPDFSVVRCSFSRRCHRQLSPSPRIEIRRCKLHSPEL